MRLYSILLIPFLALACGGDDSDDGAAGAAGSSGEAGNAGATSQAGSSGASADMHCEEMTTYKGACMCISDPNDKWGPNEGIGSCSQISVGIGASYCCAGEGYPEQSTCSCRPWACSESESSCICGPGEAETSTSTNCVKSFPTCCVHEVGGAVSLCMCTNGTSCPSGDVQVSGCGVVQAKCSDYETKVDTCLPK